MLNIPSVGSEIQITPAHCELVRHNGVIEIGPLSIQIDHQFVRAEQRTSIDLPSLIYFLRVLEEVRRQYREAYLLMVVSPQVGVPPPENRRWAAAWDRQHGVNAVAIVSSHNPLYVIVIGLLLRAMSLLRSGDSPSAFFTTEVDARAWLDTQRLSDRRGAT